MTKFCNDKTGSDKMLHVFCEFVIAAIVGSLVSFIHFPSAWIAAVIAFVVAFAFGIWKEVKDSKQKGNHFCIWDIAWDLVGSLAGAVVAFLADTLPLYKIYMTEIILISLSCLIMTLYLLFICALCGIPNSISETYYQRFGSKWVFSGVLFVAASLAVVPLMNHTPESYQFLAFLIIAGIFFIAASPAFKDEFEGKVHTGAALVLCVATFAWLILTAGVPYVAIAGVAVGVIRRKEFIFWLETGLLYNLYTSLLYIML